MSCKQIGDKLGCSKTVVQLYLRKHGLSLTRSQIYAKISQTSSKRSTSSPDIDRILKRDYLRVPIKRMATNIGRSQVFVRTRLRQLGLEIPSEITSAHKRQSQHKPGHIPYNKGLKMSEELKQKVSHTFFKKGNLPHNTKERDGVITVRSANKSKYKWIRLSIGNWQMYHQYRWQMYRGEIPPGHCLWFKNGDTMDCRLSNLELITRAENARRNRFKFMSQPEPIRKAQHLLNKITTKIKQHEKQNH